MSFAGCLTEPYHNALPSLTSKMEAALGAGGAPFDVTVGAPVERYGARVTFGSARDPCRLAAAFGLETHPWGVPCWVGIRVSPTGATDVKPYHRLGRLDDRFAFPAGFPGDLYPVAASLQGDRKEVYLRRRAVDSWESFVERALAPFGGGDYPFRPRPMKQADSFGLSVGWLGERPKAISLYAFSGALPNDLSTERQWTGGMNEIDAAAYGMALIAARSLGRLKRGKRHGLLAWTLELGAGWRRAASLNVVPAEFRADTAAARRQL